MFSKDLEHSIGQCYKRARDARHEFMTVEHLVLALIDNPSAEAVLKAVNADIPRLRHELEEAIEVSVNRLAEDDGRDTQPTLGFQRVLQRAVYHVQSSGKKEVTGANVLVAVFGEKDSHAVYFLNQQDVHRLDVVNYISHGVARQGDDAAPQSQEGEGKAAEFDPRDEGGEEDKNREAVRKAESQVFVQVERRSAENRETGRQYLHDHSEEEQPRQEDERPACVAADRSHGGAS